MEHLVLGGPELTGTSVKVTEEETGNSCVSIGSKQGEGFPPPHSNLQLDIL